MKLKSSRIEYVEYNDSINMLVIQFVNGGKYKYFSVPEEVYNKLINSKSPGNFFDSFIKGKYNFKKF